MKKLTILTVALLLTALVQLTAQPVQAEVSIPDDNLAAAIRETLDLPTDAVITADTMLDLTELYASGREITALTGLEHATNLTELNLWGTGVSDVSPLAGLTQLTTLDLEFVAVVSDVSPLAGLTQLTWLRLYGTGVSDVSPLAGLTQLTWLNLGDTGVSDVSPLAGLTQLTYLGLHGTSVSDVSPLAGLTQLTTLWLSNTGVSDVSPLAGLTQLTELGFDGTGVSDVSPLAGLTQLTWLRLYGTGVSDVSPLAGLTQLTWLNLGDTGVSDVSPLAGLTQLTELDLRGTGVSDVSPLLGLNLTGTSWSSIGLRLTGSPLSYASLHTHIPALQAKGIEVEFDNVAHPALLKTSGNGQEGAPAATLKTPFVVEAMDEHGKPIVGIPVQFDILAGGGMLSAQTATTDAQGIARVTFTLGSSQGVNKVNASSEGIQSWVLFTAVATEEVPQLISDVNGDGIVNIQDLVLVSGQFGETGKNSADVNGDGVVNIQDLVLVAGAFGEGAAAPSARAVALSRLTVSDVEGWLNEARAVSSVGQDRPILTSFSPQTHILSGSGSGDPELQSGSASRPGGLSYSRGIAVLEQLLANFMPQETALLANYPNPFNPETWIPYQLANPAEVTVTIYAANGAVVRTLDLGHRRAGSYASRSRAAYWDGRNAQGEPVASGVYFYTLQAGDFSATRKMVIRK